MATTAVVTIVTVDNRRSNDRHNNGCRDTANMVMVVAIDDCAVMTVAVNDHQDDGCCGVGPLRILSR